MTYEQKANLVPGQGGARGPGGPPAGISDEEYGRWLRESRRGEYREQERWYSSPGRVTDESVASLHRREPEPAGPAGAVGAVGARGGAPQPQPQLKPKAEPAAWEQIVLEIPGPVVVSVPPGSHGSYVPDTECDGWSTNFAALRVASVRGQHHRYYGKPRQDAARAVADARSETIVFAVADGVSSAESAEEGALQVCAATIHDVLGQLEGNGAPVDWRRVVDFTARTLYRQTARRLRTEQVDQGQVERLFATTLVAGAAHRSQGGLEISLCRVGDSGAWVLDLRSGRYQSIFAHKTDPDAAVVSSAVSALPRIPEHLEQITFLLDPDSVLLVGTDGFGDPLGDGEGLVGELFAKHLAEPPPPAWLAHLLDFSRETFDDDRTLLALWPRGKRAPR